MIRNRVLEQLAGDIAAVRRPHPVRVAVDGIDAAGKTTLADELVYYLHAKGRPIIRASIDDFHNPRDVRYRQGRDSPNGYYEDSFNYPALLSQLLKPLGPGGDGYYRPAVFDVRKNRPVRTKLLPARNDVILLFDGIFLQRPILRAHWDLIIYVDVSFEQMLLRVADRDTELFGTVEDPQGHYQRRYMPGQHLYIDKCNPRQRADIVVNNEDPGNPQLLYLASQSDNYPYKK